MAQTTPHIRLLKGDESDLFREHEHALKRAVRNAANAPEACIEDACSFAWLQLMRCQPRRETVFPWLCKVAIHEAWRLAARERRERHLELVPAWEERCTTEPAPIHEAHAALRLLADLPERQRRYLVLLIAGLTYDEIATHCNATYTNVNKHLTRARARIRRLTTHPD